MTSRLAVATRLQAAVEQLLAAANRLQGGLAQPLARAGARRLLGTAGQPLAAVVARHLLRSREGRQQVDRARRRLVAASPRARAR